MGESCHYWGLLQVSCVIMARPTGVAIALNVKALDPGRSPGPGKRDCIIPHLPMALPQASH